MDCRIAHMDMVTAFMCDCAVVRNFHLVLRPARSWSVRGYIICILSLLFAFADIPPRDFGQRHGQR